jgi:hypothetical protein
MKCPKLEDMTEVEEARFAYNRRAAAALWVLERLPRIPRPRFAVPGSHAERGEIALRWAAAGTRRSRSMGLEGWHFELTFGLRGSGRTSAGLVPTLNSGHSTIRLRYQAKQVISRIAPCKTEGRSSEPAASPAVCAHHRALFVVAKGRQPRLAGAG